MNYYLKFLTNFNFAGRARRAEFWWVFLINLVASIVLNIVGTTTHLTYSPLGPDMAAQLGPMASFYTVSIPAAVYGLLTLIQSLALTVRRLHDRGMSGWWLLLFIPLCLILIGYLILLIIFVLEGTKGPNKYGEDPKASAAAPAAA
jgi:uncharacterized membrane protein YhaH (DUF805 family)